MVNLEAPMSILDLEPSEGLSSCFFSDACLANDASKLVVVGTFEPTEKSPDPEKTLLRNILRSRFPQRVEVYNMEPSDFFTKNIYAYDIVCLRLTNDGATTTMIKGAFQLLKNGGLLWMYGYLSPEGESTEMTSVVDAFIADKGEEATIVHRAKEIAIIKVAKKSVVNQPTTYTIGSASTTKN